MDNSKFKGKVASFSTVDLDTSQTSADVNIIGDCVKVEICSLGSTLQLQTSEGENPIAPLGRTWYSSKGFNSLKISGYQVGEKVTVTVGWGFIVDTPGQNPLVPDYVAPGLIEYSGQVAHNGQKSFNILPGTVGYIEISGTAASFQVQGSFLGSIYGQGNGTALDLYKISDGTSAGNNPAPGQYRFNLTGFTQITVINPDNAQGLNYNLFVAGVGLIAP